MAAGWGERRCDDFVARFGPNVGATAHNTFKIPVEVLTAESLCNLKLSRLLSPAVQVIVEAALLLIEKAPMMNKHAYGAFDRSLRDITSFNDSTSFFFFLTLSRSQGIIMKSLV